jgi:hypothetical protein
MSTSRGSRVQLSELCHQARVHYVRNRVKAGGGVNAGWGGGIKLRLQVRGNSRSMVDPRHSRLQFCLLHFVLSATMEGRFHNDLHLTHEGA